MICRGGERGVSAGGWGGRGGGVERRGGWGASGMGVRGLRVSGFFGGRNGGGRVAGGWWLGDTGREQCVCVRVVVE